MKFLKNKNYENLNEHAYVIRIYSFLTAELEIDKAINNSV